MRSDPDTQNVDLTSLLGTSAAGRVVPYCYTSAATIGRLAYVLQTLDDVLERLEPHRHDKLDLSVAYLYAQTARNKVRRVIDEDGPHLIATECRAEDLEEQQR